MRQAERALSLPHMPALDIAPAGEPDLPSGVAPAPLKIALIGTASNSRALAPIADPAWTIWASSPGNIGIPRVDRFYEIHDRKTILECYKGKDLEWLQGLGEKVTVAFDIPELPLARRLPVDEIEAKHDPEFLTSTPAWMMAEAIPLEPEAMGLWGFNMAAETEYAAQRPGCKHFLELARFCQIHVVLPPNTPLNHRPLPYPFRHYTPMMRWLYDEMASKTKLRSAAEMQRAHHDQEYQRLSGWLDAMKQVKDNWT